MNSLNSNKNNCLTFQKFIQALGGHVMYNPLHFLNTTLPVPVARCPLCPGLLPLRVCPPAASALLCPPFILPTVPTFGPGWKQPWLSGATPSLTSSQPQYSLFTIVFHQPTNKLPIKCSASTHQQYQLQIYINHHVFIHHFIVITPYHPNFIPLSLSISYSSSSKPHPVTTIIEISWINYCDLLFLTINVFFADVAWENKHNQFNSIQFESRRLYP